MKKLNYKFFLITLSILSVYFFTANSVFNASAQSLKEDLNSRLFNVSESANYAVAEGDDVDLALFIGDIISYVLAMLGVIFLVLLVYGGFMWMLARGDSEEVNKSKDIIINAVIGLAIVLISYAITYYVVANLVNTTMTTG